MLDAATEVTIVSNSRLPWGGASYEYANRVQFGLARLCASALGVPLRPIAVWDRAPGDGPGGTAFIVASWRDVGFEAEIIDLARMLADADRSHVTTTDSVALHVSPGPEPDPTFPPEIRAMLFADVRGFSQLTEPQIPTFVREVLGGVAGLIRDFHAAPLVKNTWGDALYLVFDGVRDAGLFALELARRIGALDREALAPARHPRLPDRAPCRAGLRVLRSGDGACRRTEAPT